MRLPRLSSLILATVLLAPPAAARANPQVHTILRPLDQLAAGCPEVVEVGPVEPDAGDGALAQDQQGISHWLAVPQGIGSMIARRVRRQRQMRCIRVFRKLAPSLARAAPMRLPRLSSLILFTVLLAAAAAAQANPQVQTIWRLLDYVAVDYPEAVQGGAVVNQLEYDEMLEFSATVHERLGQLPGHEAQDELIARSADLQATIAAKGSPAEVEMQARSLAEALLQAYPVPRAPEAAPDLSGAAALYQQQCASCHGTTGAGDGAAGAGMDPPPIDFTDAARARQRSVFALQQVIEQGLEDTSMLSYAHLPEEQRWALAFYIGQFAFPAEGAAAGQALWNDNDAVRAAVPDLSAMVQALPHGLAGLAQPQADDLTAYLRRFPGEAAAIAAADLAEGGALELARTRLAEGVQAYADGDARVARGKLLSAYLDGLEPIEPLLVLLDGKLLLDL